MTMSEKFCLKWNDFHSNVTKSFINLRREEDFYDVTLVCDDQKQISAHKVVLSSSSEFFKYILKQNKHSHPLLCLEGIDSRELNNVLDYVYHGEVSIHQDDLDRFLSVAQRLKLEGLIAEQNVFNMLEEQNALNMLTENISKDIGYNDTKIEDNQTIQNDKLTESKAMISTQFSPLILNSENFQNLEELDAKILEILVRDQEGLWNCLMCGKKSMYKGHIREHAEIHFEGLAFSCPDPNCDYIARQRCNLRKHIKKHQ